MAKKSKAQLAARGTVADPTRKDADRLRTEAKQSVGKSAKLVGVMPEDMANEVQATGTVPFTFKSAFLLAGAVLLGTIVIPFFAFQVGVSVGVSTTCAAPMLTAAAWRLVGTSSIPSAGCAVGFTSRFWWRSVR